MRHNAFAFALMIAMCRTGHHFAATQVICIGNACTRMSTGIAADFDP
jgi:hypothetical protein